jgi:hypothetical protein
MSPFSAVPSAFRCVSVEPCLGEASTLVFLLLPMGLGVVLGGAAVEAEA